MGSAARWVIFSSCLFFVEVFPAESNPDTVCKMKIWTTGFNPTSAAVSDLASVGTALRLELNLTHLKETF